MNPMMSTAPPVGIEPTTDRLEGLAMELYAVVGLLGTTSAALVEEDQSA